MRERVRILTRALIGALWMTGAGAAAYAQALPINVDQDAPGARAVVDHQHGVPVVDIAAPTAGVSVKQFTDFNVGPAGVILNNSHAASQTQLAGQIAGNPHLGRGPAATILNQVTAPNPSQLRGLLQSPVRAPTSSWPTPPESLVMAADSSMPHAPP